MPDIHHKAKSFGHRHLEIANLLVAGKAAQAFEEHRELIIDEMRDKARRSRLKAAKSRKDGNRAMTQKYLSIARVWELAMAQVKGLRDYRVADQDAA